MGRGLDPVWDYYYRIDEDIPSLNLRAKANSAHNNGWCKNCVKVTLLGPEVTNWVPTESFIVESGNLENARRYKAMSLLLPYTGVPARLRSHLSKCLHSRHVVIPPAVVHARRKSSHANLSPSGPSSSIAASRATYTGTPTKIVAKRASNGKFSEEEQGEFNVHLYHLFTSLDIPFESLSNPGLASFLGKYIPQANLPSRSLFYTLAASRNLTTSSLSAGPPDSTDFQGLARLAAGFTAGVAGGSGVVDPDIESDDMTSYQ